MQLLHYRYAGVLLASMTFLTAGIAARAEDNGVALSPLMGWSSWSAIRSNPNESIIKAEALSMHNNLQSHGYQYINIDDFWYLNPNQTVDQYGRWVSDSGRFPNGIASVAAYVHSLGLKFGIYLTPGVPVAAVNQNTPIEGTNLHARDIADTSRYEPNYNFGNCMYPINFTKAGAQEYANSWAKLLASWGVDYVKMDGVGDGDIPTVQGWSQALRQSGRPILFDLSNSLDYNNRGIWSQYSNSYRITGDIESYGTSFLTDWNGVDSRFNAALGWNSVAGPGAWSNLDSLEIGNGSRDGLTMDERKTHLTLWSMAAAPLSLGSDLTQLDGADLSLLTNDEVLSVNQAGVAGAPIQSYASQEVWRSKEPDGSYAVALFNRGGGGANVSVNWRSLGFTGSASVRDLWSHMDLGTQANGFNANLNAHACQLLKATPTAPATEYHVSSSLAAVSGGASIGDSLVSPDGKQAAFVGNGGVLQFNQVVVSKTGAYNITLSYTNGDTGSRSAVITANGGASAAAVCAPTGGWNIVSSQTVQLTLNSGANPIVVGNPSGWAPDIQSLTVQNAAPSGAAYFNLMSRSSGRYLDVSLQSLADNATMVQYAFNASDDQQWAITLAAPGYYTLTNRHSGRLLDDPGGSNTWGQQLIQYGNDGGGNQQWALERTRDGFYKVQSRVSSLFMDVSGNSQSDNAPVVQWPGNVGFNQQWMLVPAP